MTPATIQILFNGVGALFARRYPWLKILTYRLGDVHVRLVRSEERGGKIMYSFV